VRAWVGLGQALRYVFIDLCICILHLYLSSPPKKSLSKNLRLLNFANLTLHAREARGAPENPWRSVAAATERHSETNLVSCLVPGRGLEPPRLAALAPQASLSTKFQHPGVLQTLANYTQHFLNFQPLTRQMYNAIVVVHSPQ